jgi:hypothetical protein
MTWIGVDSGSVAPGGDLFSRSEKAGASPV